MVKLWKVRACRVRAPNLTDEKFYEFRRDIKDITPISFVEDIELPNHLIVVFPEGMKPAIEKYLKQNGYEYRSAEVYVKAHISKK